jgi:hypothetical protein
MALGLIAYENGSQDSAPLERVRAWVKHQLGWDAPPDPPSSPSSPPPRAALTVVPFKRPPNRRAKKGRK